jgi:hypothetical protein
MGEEEKEKDGEGWDPSGDVGEWEAMKGLDEQ